MDNNWPPSFQKHHKILDYFSFSEKFQLNTLCNLWKNQLKPTLSNNKRNYIIMILLSISSTASPAQKWPSKAKTSNHSFHWCSSNNGRLRRWRVFLIRTPEKGRYNAALPPPRSVCVSCALFSAAVCGIHSRWKIRWLVWRVNEALCRTWGWSFFSWPLLREKLIS